MNRIVTPIELLAVPPAFERCRDLLVAVDPEAPIALFGGAVRDTDYAACHGEPRPVNDYDWRVLLPDDEHQARVQEFAARLGEVAGCGVREVPSAGTGRIRYCLDYNGAEMDISIRPATSVPASYAAINRAGDADIALSAVAIDGHGTAWATQEYPSDRDERTLTVYPCPGAEDRLQSYAERMLAKFPTHRVVLLTGLDTESQHLPN